MVLRPQERASALKGQTASANVGGKIIPVKEAEPATDARNAGVASMVNFLMLRSTAQVGIEA